MPEYNDIINRSGSGGTAAARVGGALVPEQHAREIFETMPEKSVAMGLMQTLDMGTNQTRMAVMSAFPLAYWITGSTLEDRDIGLLQTTTQTWSNVYVNAEELGVIVAIPNSLLADSSVNLWEKVKPRIREAIAIKLDGTIMFGLDKPSSFPAGIAVQAISRGNSVVAGTSSIDVVDDINEVFRLVENDGFDVSGSWARQQVKGRLRGLRTSTRELLFVPDDKPKNGGNETGTLFNEKIIFSKAGHSPFATAAYSSSGPAGISLVAGDWSQAVLGVRQDIEFEVFKEGVITDSATNIQYNLMQQNMKAIRAICRYGWVVPNPINRLNQNHTSSSSWDDTDTSGNAWPFAVLKQNAGGTGE